MSKFLTVLAMAGFIAGSASMATVNAAMVHHKMMHHKGTHLSKAPKGMMCTTDMKTCGNWNMHR